MIRITLGWIGICSLVFSSSASRTLGGIPPDSAQLTAMRDEFKIMMKNKRTDELDFKQQEREFEEYQVFQKIPLSSANVSLENLRRTFTDASQATGAEVDFFKITSLSRNREKAPKVVYTDQEPFRPSQSLLVEKTRFEITLHGEKRAVDRWYENVTHEQKRLVELDGTPQKINSASRNPSWKIRGGTYRFREIKAPEVRIRTSLIQINLQNVAADPAVIKLANEVKEMAPKVLPLYQTRCRFILSGERMTFFMIKTRP